MTRRRHVDRVRPGDDHRRGCHHRATVEDADPTQRAHALALTLLDRHGVLTRGAVAAERIAGGFAAFSITASISSP